jgi:phosphoribosylanthranilate isomerase
MIAKVCGLTQAEDALNAEKFGADVLGFIFGVPVSPRNNSLERLTQLVLPRSKALKAVLLRNPNFPEVRELCQHINPDIFHLCGQENAITWDQLKNLNPERHLWQTIGVPIDEPNNEAWKYQLDQCWLHSAVDQVVLDSAKSGQSGGTGCLFPLDKVVQHLGVDTHKIVIAGGLNPDNIEGVLKTAKWAGVDVSSGLEQSKGLKDVQKIKTFLDLVHPHRS